MFFAFWALKSSILAPFSEVFDWISPHILHQIWPIDTNILRILFSAAMKCLFLLIVHLFFKRKNCQFFRRFSNDHSSFFISIYLSDIASDCILGGYDLLGQLAGISATG